MAITCPKCQFDNTPDSRFCKECGTRLISAETLAASKTLTLETNAEGLTRGTVFAERYEVLERIGAGGMGTVYRVYDRKLDEEVALKIIRPEITARGKALERFKNELKVARRIAHKNVCKMYDFGETRETAYITMEYVPGEDLKSFIRRIGQLPAAKAIVLGREIAEGLAEAHKLGIVHRDLKPGNIMIDRDGNAKIMDFGIARSLLGKRLTGEMAIIGTPEYMSPEQVDGKEADQRADLYALSIILYEMVTGRVPFEGETAHAVGLKQKSERPENPKKLNPQMPDDLGRLILKGLEKDRERRYQTAAEMFSELMRIEHLLPTQEKVVPKRKPLASREITVRFNLKKLLIPGLAIAAGATVISLILLINEPSSRPPARSGKPSLAVLYFKNNTGDEKLDIWRVALSDSIVTDLMQSRYINVLSIDQLLSILRKRGLLDARAYASEDVKRVAAEGRVNHVLQGSLSKAGDQFRIDYTLQDMVAGKIVVSSRVEGKGEASIFAMVDELTRKIKQDLKLTGAEIAGDFDKSIGQITTSSTEAYKLYVEGMRSGQMGRHRKSIEYYEKAIAVDPGFATAYRSMGGAYSNLGYFAKSLECIKRAFELSDHVSEREKLRNEAEYYGSSDRTLEKQIDAFKKLLELYPEDRNGNNNLGGTYMRLEEWDLAVERLRVCVQLNDEFPPAYENLALAYVAKGMPDEARNTIELYLNRFPDNAEVRNSAAVIDLCQSNIEAAHAEIDEALSLAPNDFGNIGIKGMIYQCQGDLTAAEIQYQSLQKNEETAAQVWRYIGLVNLGVLQGRLAESEALLRQAAEAARKAGEKDWECFFLIRSAYIYLLMGAPQKALSRLESFERLDSGLSTPVYWRLLSLPLKGMASLRLGGLSSAQKSADELRSLVDKSIYKKEIRGYYYLMGLIEIARKNFPKAVTYLSQAVSLLPGQWYYFYELHAFYVDALARAYFQAGDLEKAQTEFEKILQLTTGRLYFGDIYAKSFYMLGRIAEQRGDRAKALENYQKFLDLWNHADLGIPEVEDARKRLA